MNKKSQEQLLEEFSFELEQMTSEDVMKGIYEELQRERIESSETEFLHTISTASAVQSEDWIEQEAGDNFLKQYNDSPAIEA